MSKRKIFLEKLGVIAIFVVIAAGMVWAKPKGVEIKSELDTRLLIQAISKNDSAAKGREIHGPIAIEIITKLDSAQFNSYDVADIEMFDNDYNVHRINEKYFCAIFNKKDTIMFYKANEKIIQIMNRLFVETQTDELNDYLGG